MYPFIQKLIEIFKEKKKILARLEELFLHTEKLNLENSDLIGELNTIIQNLITLNKDLHTLSKSTAQCGATINKAYQEMMRVIGAEDYFLNKLFLPLGNALKSGNANEKIKSRAESYFSYLIKVVQIDIEYSYILLNELKVNHFLGEPEGAKDKNREAVINNFVVALQGRKFREALYWAKKGKMEGWVSVDEHNLLQSLISFISLKNFDKAREELSTPISSTLFSESQIDLLKSILEEGREAHFEALGAELEHLARSLPRPKGRGGNIGL